MTHKIKDFIKVVVILSLVAGFSIPATGASYGGSLSFTDYDASCGVNRVCYRSGSSYFLQVSGAPANQDGVIYKSDNGGDEQAISGWIRTDGSGNVTKGPWTCGVSSGEKTSTNRIRWADGSETNTLTFVCDTAAPTISLETPNYGDIYNGFRVNLNDGFGSGFSSNSSLGWFTNVGFSLKNSQGEDFHFRGADQGNIWCNAGDPRDPLYCTAATGWWGYVDLNSADNSVSTSASAHASAPNASDFICGQNYTLSVVANDRFSSSTQDFPINLASGSGCTPSGTSVAPSSGGNLSFTNPDRACGSDRFCYKDGSSYYLKVTGGPANKDGVIYKSDNGGDEQAISGWIRTDGSGNVTKGSWVCDNEKTSVNKIKWSDGSQTNTATFVCDTNSPTLTLDNELNYGDPYYGFDVNMSDGFGTGFSADSSLGWFTNIGYTIKDSAGKTFHWGTGSYADGIWCSAGDARDPSSCNNDVTAWGYVNLISPNGSLSTDASGHGGMPEPGKFVCQESYSLSLIANDGFSSSVKTIPLILADGSGCTPPDGSSTTNSNINSTNSNTNSSLGGILSFTNPDGNCGVGRICYKNGSSYSLKVTGGPANQDGVVYKTDNGGSEQVISGWIHTDALGNVTKGPWTCDSTKTSVNRIVWPNAGSSTNTVTVVCDTDAPVIPEPAINYGNVYYGIDLTVNDGFGSGFSNIPNGQNEGWYSNLGVTLKNSAGETFHFRGLDQGNIWCNPGDARDPLYCSTGPLSFNSYWGSVENVPAGDVSTVSRAHASMPEASDFTCGETYSLTLTINDRFYTPSKIFVFPAPVGCIQPSTNVNSNDNTNSSSTTPPPSVTPPVSTPPAVEPPVVHPPVQEPPKPPVVTPPTDDTPAIQPPAVKQPKSPKLKRRTTADYYN